jgi:hypothetical protein
MQGHLTNASPPSPDDHQRRFGRTRRLLRLLITASLFKACSLISAAHLRVYPFIRSCVSCVYLGRCRCDDAHLYTLCLHAAIGHDKFSAFVNEGRTGHDEVISIVRKYQEGACVANDVTAVPTSLRRAYVRAKVGQCGSRISTVTDPTYSAPAVARTDDCISREHQRFLLGTFLPAC